MLAGIKINSIWKQDFYRDVTFLPGLPKEQKEQYGLMSPEKYFYLNQGGNCSVDGKTDREDFETLMSAMQVLGFSGEERDTIFKILVRKLFNQSKKGEFLHV